MKVPRGTQTIVEHSVAAHMDKMMTAFPELKKEEFDSVNRPKHYNSHPSGIEPIQITEHMNFCLGNAIKYIWRADLKNGIEDLEKAVWYINREIEKRRREK